jgi:hypothetical protein
MPIKRADRNTNAVAGRELVEQRRAAIPAETAHGLVRALKPARRAAGYPEAVGIDIGKRPEKASELLLAHAAVADAGIGWRFQQRIPHGAALTSAAPAFVLHHRPPPGVMGGRRFPKTSPQRPIRNLSFPRHFDELVPGYPLRHTLPRYARECPVSAVIFWPSALCLVDELISRSWFCESSHVVIKNLM